MPGFVIDVISELITVFDIEIGKKQSLFTERDSTFSDLQLKYFTSSGYNNSTCLDTRQPGSAFKKLDTRQSEMLINFLQIARLIPLRT